MSYKSINRRQRLKRRRRDNRRRDLRKPNPVPLVPIRNAPTAGIITQLARPISSRALSEAIEELS
jgi:hypothetical protein